MFAAVECPRRGLCFVPDAAGVEQRNHLVVIDLVEVGVVRADRPKVAWL